MKKESKDKIEKILLFFFFTFIIFGIIAIGHLYRKYRFVNEPNCYAKTIFIGFSKNADGLTLIDYKFIAKGRIYNSFDNMNDENENKIKDTMIVKYICDDPDLSELVFE